jgi:hypothetical protein
MISKVRVKKGSRKMREGCMDNKREYRTGMIKRVRMMGGGGAGVRVGRNGD